MNISQECKDGLLNFNAVLQEFAIEDYSITVDVYNFDCVSYKVVINNKNYEVLFQSGHILSAYEIDSIDPDKVIRVIPADYSNFLSVVDWLTKR